MAVTSGSDAPQQYGSISLWNFDRYGVFRHRCGASLINRYWAVTAAHCAFDAGPNPAVLKVNQTSVRTSSLDNSSGYQELGLAKIIVHPGFEFPEGNDPPLNDIALIKFKNPVSNPNPDQFLQLSGGSPAVGTQGRVAGWGWNCDDTVGIPDTLPNCGLPYPHILQATNLEVTQDSRCGWFNDPATQLCTVGANGRHTMACRGDSGAPLVRKSIGNTYMLLGIVVGDGDLEISHPNECDENSTGGQGTGVFTDIAPYRLWIIQNAL